MVVISPFFVLFSLLQIQVQCMVSTAQLQHGPDTNFQQTTTAQRITRS